MPLNRERIKEIANQKFAQDSTADIQTWLRGAIFGWMEQQSVLSFSPFENFFPSTQDEMYSFSQILQALPTEKTAGRIYSLRDQFRTALIKLIATKDVYLSDPDVWQLFFDLAKELELNECISAVLPIVSDRRFRQKRNSSGKVFFDAALRLSFTFGPTNDVIKFWKFCLPFIEEAPHLSTQLFLRLVETDPSRWADFALETKLKTALIIYYEKQAEYNFEVCEKRFEKLRHLISSNITDFDYISGVKKLKFSDLDFLIDMNRIRELADAEYHSRMIVDKHPTPIPI